MTDNELRPVFNYCKQEEQEKIVKVLTWSFSRLAEFRMKGSETISMFGNLWQQLISKMSSNKKVGLLIVLILLLNILKGLLFATIVPIWEAPDEPYYFAYTKVLVEERRIPNKTEPLPVELQNVLWTKAELKILDKGVNTMRAAGHPPLYPIISTIPYLLSKPLGNNYQVFAIRFLGVIFGTFVVLFGFKIAKVIFPEDTLMQLLVPTFLAFNPQFSFVAASVNSDSMLIFLFSLFLYQVVRIIADGFTCNRMLWLSVTFMVGVLTKERFLIALPVLAIVISAWLVNLVSEYIKDTKSYQHINRSKIILYISVIAILLLIAVFLFRKSESLFFGRIVSILSKWYSLLSIKTLGVLLIQRNYLPRMFRQFWGYFGWLTIPLPQTIYNVIKWMTLLCGVGLGISITKMAREAYNNKDFSCEKKQFISLSLFIFVVFLTLLVTAYYDFADSGGQGRYLFVSIIPIFFFYSLGVKGLCPTKKGKKGFFLLVFSSLLALNMASVFYIIFPFYYA